MLKIDNFEVMGWEHAIRGMRNPMNSWEKSDSGYCEGRGKKCDTCIYKPDDYEPCYFASTCMNKLYVVGPNDYKLTMSLRNSGTDHRKFMRMITVYVDITAPLYWWKEFDTYKIGTTANSGSTMHKIAEKKFTIDDFSHEHLQAPSKDLLLKTIEMLNDWREHYQVHSNVRKTYWWQMIQLLPSSYNQRRTVMLNYEVLANIYKSRRNHKLDEWGAFCDWIKELPYSEIITDVESCF